MICPVCGRKPSYSIEEYQYLESGLKNVFVQGVGIFKCQCGQEYVQLPGAQAVHDQIANALLHKKSLLTGVEARFLRKWIRHTSEELATKLGYTRVSVSRWENKEVYPDSADRALRLYASALGSVSVDFSELFASLSPSEERDFRITVGEIARKSPTVTLATFSADTALSRYASAAVGHVAMDSSMLFASLNLTQDKDFRITVGEAAFSSKKSFKKSVRSAEEPTKTVANQELAQAA